MVEQSKFEMEDIILKTLTFLLIGVVSMVSLCFAQNLCELIAPLGLSTEIEQRREFESTFEGRILSGSGTLLDIEGHEDDKYLNAIVSCTENARIHLQVRNDTRMRHSAVKPGDKISFWGKCVGMDRGHYKNGPGRYFLLKLGGDSVQINP